MQVRGIALVDGTASHLHRAKDDGVAQHLSALTDGRGWVWGEEGETRKYDEIITSDSNFGDI